MHTGHRVGRGSTVSCEACSLAKINTACWCAQCNAEETRAQQSIAVASQQLQPGLEADSMTNKDIMPEQDANA